ncbi:MAG: sugar transferase [Caulobacteraceae bacterium]
MRADVTQAALEVGRSGEALERGASRWRLDLTFALVAILVCFVAAPDLYEWVVEKAGGPLNRPATMHILANACANLLALVGSWSSKGRLDEKLGKSLNAALASHGFLALVVVLTHSFYSNAVMISAAVVSVALGLLAVLIRHRLQPRRVALVDPLATMAEALPPGCERIDDAADDLRGFDLILTGPTEELPPQWTRAVSRAMLAGRTVQHYARYLEETRGIVSIEHFEMDHLPEGGIGSYQAGKRLFDLVLAALALPLALPILAVSCLAILVSMGRPVFFIQPRVGLGGRSFRIVKLRTMTAGEARPDVEGRMASAQGQRVTALGVWLRRLRIDELPQLWHVLIGEMSFVGPRPEWTLLAERYSAQLPAYAYRHLVRPGITGWAQVRSGYAADLQQTRVKVGYDLFYLKHLSFGLDLQILLRTVIILLTARGAR